MPATPSETGSFAEWCERNSGELVDDDRCYIDPPHGRPRLVTREEYANY